MQIENIKVGEIYFYNWKSFLKIKSMTDKAVEYVDFYIDLSTNREKFRMETDVMDRETFENRIVKNLKRDIDAKEKKQIFFFLFNIKWKKR